MTAKSRQKEDMGRGRVGEFSSIHNSIHRPKDAGPANVMFGIRREPVEGMVSKVNFRGRRIPFFSTGVFVIAPQGTRKQESRGGTANCEGMRTKSASNRADAVDRERAPVDPTPSTWELGKGSLPYFGLAQAFDTSPPVLPEIVPGFFGGTVGMLVAPGGTGKSSWALLLALSVATGWDLLGMRTSDPTAHQWVSGPVLFWTVQDPDAMVHRRVHVVNQWFKQRHGIHEARRFRRDAVDRLKIVTRLPKDLTLNGHDPTGWSVLHRAIQAEGFCLVIVDPLRAFHTGEENASQEMSALFKEFDGLTRASGTAVLVVHHTAKGRTTGQADTARGSGVLTNDVRWQGHLVEMDPARPWARSNGAAIRPDEAHRFICWHGAKQNYATREPDHWFERRPDGMLEPIALTALRQHDSRSLEEVAGRSAKPSRPPGVAKRAKGSVQRQSEGDDGDTDL